MVSNYTAYNKNINIFMFLFSFNYANLPLNISISIFLIYIYNSDEATFIKNVMLVKLGRNI